MNNFLKIFKNNRYSTKCIGYNPIPENQVRPEPPPLPSAPKKNIITLEIKIT